RAYQGFSALEIPGKTGLTRLTLRAYRLDENACGFMVSRCWKCGVTKRERMHRPRILVWPLRLIGFGLYSCAGCHAWRVLPRGSGPYPTETPKAPPARAPTSPHQTNDCPHSGRANS